MTREETQKILMAVQAAYPGYKVQDKTYTLNLWTDMLGDLTYDQVGMALKRFIATDTKGFAPSIGQIRASIQTPERGESITDGEAWNLVYNALCNSNYHANEEYNKLPGDIRRAVGGADTLRAWAVMDEEAITVAESNFKRSYRAIIAIRERDAVLPPEMRIGRQDAPVAAIEETQEREEVKRIDPEELAAMLDPWRDEL